MPATHVAGIVLHIQPEQLFLHSLHCPAFSLALFALIVDRLER
jgi:hypothetical protein